MADDALGLLAACASRRRTCRRVDGRHDRASDGGARAAAGAQPDVHHVEQRPARLARPHAAARNALLQRPKRNASRAELMARMAATVRVIGSPPPVSENCCTSRIEAALERGSCPEGVARQMVAIAASGDRTALLPSTARPGDPWRGRPPDPVACGIDTAALILGARMEVIEGMGHDMPPQLIERLLALIDVHLQGKMAPQMRSQPARRAHHLTSRAF
jgi:proline iminopeptidase